MYTLEGEADGYLMRCAEVETGLNLW
jgi:hypothetical protein